MTCSAVVWAEESSSEIIEPEITEEQLDHWSFRPVVAVKPPAVENENQVINEIDRFILARLESDGLSFMPAADRAALIRRLSFDLRGLPPSTEELKSFLHDSSPEAYEKLIDSYLASPAYGERWAQHWLDVVRFAESDGFEHDQVRSDAWRYRDWVIQALNDDMPYDEFVRRQIAGDEMYPNDPDSAIATGFLVAGPDMPDINLMEERRHTVLNEMTLTTGAALMGLTLGCAQCHDHKSDPVSQADFYRMRAIFGDMAIPQKMSQLPHTFIPLSGGVPANHLVYRGDFRNEGPEVNPAFLRVVNASLKTLPRKPKPDYSSGPRLELANWLTHPDHPLTSRVLVNRLWQHHFDNPIVGTPNDFGVLGNRPTHPELLDWLAAELINRDWSLKAMHKLMLLSATYRQTSKPVNDQWSDAVEKDPDNRLLSRMNRKRLDGEVIRDTLLAVGNRLNRKQGGPGVHPPLPKEVAITLIKKQWEVSEDQSEHYRRSIYLFVRRNLRYPMFDVFDRPDGNASCGRRNVSTTAPQSLTLLNSDFTLQSARYLAGTILDQGSTEAEEWVEEAYLRFFSRLPTEEELQTGISFIEEQANLIRQENRERSDLALPEAKLANLDPYTGAAFTDFCLALFNLNEAIYLD